MSDNQKALPRHFNDASKIKADALAWIDRAVDPDASVAEDETHRRTLKAMFVQPRLPEEPSEEMLIALWGGFQQRCMGEINADQCRRAYANLYAHLTKPKTRTVKVWRVMYTCRGRPHTATLLSLAEAEKTEAHFKLCSSHDCIRITGPHEQEVST